MTIVHVLGSKASFNPQLYSPYVSHTMEISTTRLPWRTPVHNGKKIESSTPRLVAYYKVLGTMARPIHHTSTIHVTRTYAKFCESMTHSA